MKSVLISIQPKWCELIASGKKTIEVRKTRPKLETPFKVYIYCTLQCSNEFFKELKERFGEYEALSKWNRENWGIRKGKVIGEFVCDKITYLGNISTDPWCALLGDVHEWHKRLVTKDACLTEEELLKYGGKYGWHISNLVIYDKPRELREFQKPCIRDYCDCAGCENAYFSHDYGFEGCALEEGLTRPPQSYCYVESEVE